MKTFAPVLIALFLLSCGETQNRNAESSDTMSKKDSVKKALSEDLPPADEIHQFNWFYSAFVSALVNWDDTAINACINKERGLWVIDRPGAVPHFTKVMTYKELRDVLDITNFKFDRMRMTAAPVEAELPVVNCSSTTGYNKDGCFTTETNLFRLDKIWTAAGLVPSDEDAVKSSAETITRTVVNTWQCRFYFSLINGAWYLTFIDVMKPCEA